MSIDAVDRNVLVKLEREKAYSTLEECEFLVEKQRWPGAAGRLYYTVFHAVCALLIHDQHRVKTHKGAGIMFSQIYIRTSLLPPQYGDLFFQLEYIREKSDYDCFYNVSDKDVQLRLPQAKEMIDTIAAMVKE
ncbi:MAG: HEPN domain-containing protein [Bacteroidales bacterium]|nr:HEPN domain-containing protein [Bacteroidales bacterium]